jgi:hypothetical protein
MSDSFAAYLRGRHTYTEDGARLRAALADMPDEIDALTDALAWARRHGRSIDAGKIRDVWKQFRRRAALARRA